MYFTKQKKKIKILAIIPARKGSKELPGKNKIQLLGKPLIAYTIKAATQSKTINKTIVSSDDIDILKISKQMGVEINKRPAYLSQDTSTSEDVINYILDLYPIKKEGFNAVMLLQPTSPLRTSYDIDSSVKLFMETKATSIISVYNIGIKPFKSYYLNKNGFLKGVFNNKSPNKPRQSLPDAYQPNGAIYLTGTDQFLKTKSLFSQSTLPFVMSKEESIDIDSLEDLKSVEQLLKRNENV